MKGVFIMSCSELEYRCGTCGDNTRGIMGESINITLRDNCEPEIKVDSIVKEFDTIRIWGQVKNCGGQPIPKMLLMLLHSNCGKYRGIAHTISDCQGFYQFDLCEKSAAGQYKVIVGRACQMEGVLDSLFPGSEECGQCKKKCWEQPVCDKPCFCKKGDLCETCVYYDKTTGVCCYKGKDNGHHCACSIE